MLIIGELINTSRQQVREAVENRNVEYIKELARRQTDAGATCIDINCGTIVENEPEIIKWLVSNVQDVVETPLSIDTPNPAAMEAALLLVKTKPPFVNSITAETQRYRAFLPLILKYNAKVVALCMTDNGVPETPEDRIGVVRWLVDHLTSAGIPTGHIYLDPLIKPISTSDNAGLDGLETVRLIRREYPDVHIVCGLSNISFGMPNRKVLNQAFMIQAMVVGVDSYILDPLDQATMGFFYASQALLGQDRYCMEYLKAHRRGLYK